MTRQAGRPVALCAALAALVVVTRFWHAAQFGLYEDDYFHAAYGFDMGARRALQTIGEMLGRFWHARPLGWVMVFGVSRAAYRAGGIVAVYGAAAAMITANAIAFYLLMRRVSLEEPSRQAGRPVAPRSDGLFAAAAAVAFCLFPADTTQAFLTHMFLQFSLFLMLLSLHAYLAGHEWVARALAAATLVCYESVYLLSLPAPMLDPGWNRGRWHRAARHVTWSLAVAGVYGALRAVLRESRVAELDAGTAVWAAVWNTLTGPVYALGMYGVRAVDAVRALDGELALWCVVGAAILWWVLTRAEAGDAPVAPLVWRGLLLAALAYPLAVILSSADVTGRSSRVHMAAGPGAAMVVGAACTWLLRRRRAVLAPAIALGLSLLVGFGHMVQHGYRASWEEQKALWRSVDTLCRDISDGTVLILDAGARTEPERFIEPVGWSVGIAMRKVFEFPAAWREAPLAERAQNLWVDEGRLAVKVQQDGTSHVLPARNTILLEYRAGQWERRAGVFEWGGAAVELKPAPSAELPPLRRGLLYGEVFGR